MPALGVAKRRQDARLDSAANTLLGWWWLDPGRRGSAAASRLRACVVMRSRRRWLHLLFR